MKTRILLLGLVAGTFALSSLAQTTTETNAPSAGTNSVTTTVPQFLTLTYNTLIGSGLTNLDLSGGMSYSPKSKQWGEFMTLHRNLEIGGGSFVAPGVGIEHYGNAWYALQLQTTLGVNTTPLSGWTNVLGSKIGGLVFTPFSTMGMETPFGGGTSSSTPGAFVAAGGAVHLATVPWIKADFGIGGTIGTRVGLSDEKLNGKFYTGFVNLLWKF